MFRNERFKQLWYQDVHELVENFLQREAEARELDFPASIAPPDAARGVRETYTNTEIKTLMEEVATLEAELEAEGAAIGDVDDDDEEDDDGNNAPVALTEGPGARLEARVAELERELAAERARSAALEEKLARAQLEIISLINASKPTVATP